MSLTDIAKKTGKAIGHVAGATLFQGHYFIKLNNSSWGETIGYGTGFAFVINLFLTAGDLTITKANTEEYELGNHTIKIERLEHIDKHNSEKHGGKYTLAKFFLSPGLVVYDMLTPTKMTIIDDKYKIEGDDILEYTPEQGFIINTIAIKERNFYIDDEKYDQKELSDLIRKKTLEYKDIQKELSEMAASGDRVGAMELNIEYTTELKKAKGKFSEIETIRNNLIDSLNVAMRDMNEESQTIRNETKAEYNRLDKNKLIE